MLAWRCPLRHLFACQRVCTEQSICASASGSDLLRIWLIFVRSERASYNIPASLTKLDIRTFAQLSVTMRINTLRRSGIIRKGEQLECAGSLTIFIHMHTAHPTDTGRLDTRAWERRSEGRGAINSPRRSKINGLEGATYVPAINFAAKNILSGHAELLKYAKRDCLEAILAMDCIVGICVCPKKQVSV